MTLLIVLTALAFAAAIVVARVLATAAPAGRLVSQAAGAGIMVVMPIVTLVLAIVLAKFGIGGETLGASEILRTAALPAFGTLFVAPVAFWFFRRQRPALTAKTRARTASAH
ncbi:sodium:proton exchanger [Rhodopseudomonas sp. HC1]|uniref:sodium:proton exchanger n=1 Tax=Rhodopseudomonas infernalis TaxID=2897386 RepID=UPI001EE980C0|nr:sodium:proton exchanger [Rhodopseudomonas infernalis]MCG6207359.1 sodium:proton exchanger [Rhodopseudomonas infernalis]